MFRNTQQTCEHVDRTVANLYKMSNPAMVRLLEHSSLCSDESCVQPVECKQMKQLLTHLSNCAVFSCVICKDVKDLAMVHSQSCCNNSCKVAQCQELRASAQQAHSMLRKYSSDLAILQELKLSTSTAPKSRGTYKCGQCGMPKIRPHKCGFVTTFAHGQHPMCIQTGGQNTPHHPDSPNQATSSARLHNPHWNTRPDFHLGNGAHVEPIEYPIVPRHAMKQASARAMKSDAVVVSPKDPPLAPPFAVKPRAVITTDEEADGPDDAVRLPSHGGVLSKSDPRLAQHRDITYINRRHSKLKMRKAKALSKQQMDRATNRVFSRSTAAHLSDSDSGASTSNTGCWPETAPYPMVASKRARQGQAIARSRPIISNTSDPYGIRQHLRRVRAAASRQQPLQQSGGDPAATSSSDDGSGDGGGGEEEDEEDEEETAEVAALTAGSRGGSDESTRSVSASLGLGKISLGGDAVDHVARARYFLNDASLPCETTVAARGDRGPDYSSENAVNTVEKVTLVSKPPPAKIRRIAEVVDPAASSDSSSSGNNNRQRINSVCSYRLTPSPSFCLSPDLSMAFRNAYCAEGGAEEEVVDEEEEEEVFKYLNDEIAQWM